MHSSSTSFLKFTGHLKRLIDMRATIFTGIWDYASSAAIRCYCFPRLDGSLDRSCYWVVFGVAPPEFALFLPYPSYARSGGEGTG